MMRRFLVAGLAVAAIVTALSAEQTGGGSISGRVMDRTKGILPGVRVTASGDSRRSVVTDAEGQYQINELPPGS